MNHKQLMIKQATAGWSVVLVAMALSLGAGAVLAQTTGSNKQGTPEPAAAAINAATAQGRESQRTAIEAALLPYTPITIVVTPAVGPAVAAPALPGGPATAPALAPATPPVTAAAPGPAITAVPRPMAPAVVIPDTGAADAVRIMRVPAACTPKTNSLDCVQDSTQPGQGANVEGRVRNSVMGEVGTGKATTEGGGGAKRQQACTPKPGELTCTP